MIVIRPETSADHSAIHRVTLLAFGQEEEARLVDRLRTSSNFIPELSLVALENNRVVGHILFSHIAIRTAKGEIPALSLAPMAVLPEYQNRGIGSMLVRTGIEKVRELGHRIVVVVGHPAFYPRFGFSPAKEFGLELPFPAPDEVFLVLDTMEGAISGIMGMVAYPPEFDDVT